MAREILASVDEQERRIVILENGQIEDYFFERAGETSLLNNIYKGIVEDITPALGAVFVNVGLEKKGFLYLDESAATVFRSKSELSDKSVGQIVRRGDILLVQVSKEPFGGKGARLTTNITLAGKYVVLVPFSNLRGVSKKIVDDEERSRLKEIISRIKAPYGIIVRTAAVGISSKEIEKDIKFLVSQWRKIYMKAIRATAPALVHKEQDILLRVVRDYFDESVDRLVIDDRKEYMRIRSFVRTIFPKLLNRVEYYRAQVPLFELRAVDRQLAQIYEPVVHLSCGGYLIIEQTNALTVIDVNSGRFKGISKKQEEMAFIVNCEAAQEIGRQLRLRDIGGIIVIDFIDMKYSSHREEVLSLLKTALSRDKAKSEIVSISPLGLVELTRQRTERTNQDRAFVDCPCCGGKGKVLSPQSVLIIIYRELVGMLRYEKKRKRMATIKVHKQVLEYLRKHKQMFVDLKRRFLLECNFIGTIDIKPDEYNLEVVEVGRRV